MTNTFELIDRRALDVARERSQPSRSVLFKLYPKIVEDIATRLIDLNIKPQNIAIISHLPKIWNDKFPFADFVMDKDTLEFPSAEYDLIIHGMCLHQANDPIGQFIQCRNACNQNGLFIASTFGSNTLQELRTALINAEISIRDGTSPRVIPFGNLVDLTDLALRSGLKNVVSDRHEEEISFPSIFELMTELKHLGETNCLISRQVNFTPKCIFNLANEFYTDHFSNSEDGITATFEVITITGWISTN